ncbi:MAG: cytidylate kinase-like family protein [Merdibacter sp.]|nr:cytidylate kinase-like family protein [Merdibacter sp.]
MAKKVIITISRQYGSGGKIIGEKLAEELGIVCYDKVFLENITKKLGVSSAFFQDDNRGENGLYEVGSHGPLSKVASLSVNNKVFESASKLIREIAAKESAVIVGRCGDYVLKDEENVLSLFIYADKKERLQRGIELYHLDPKDAEETIRRFDRKRANFYEFYTDRKWGALSNYSMTVNTSRMGIEQCVKYLAAIVKEMQRDDA